MMQCGVFDVFLRFGVNYMLLKDWMYFWFDFDFDDVCCDFVVFVEFGFDYVCVFLLWMVLQLNCILICVKVVDDVCVVVDIVGEFGLDVSIDVIQGYFFSFDFVLLWLYMWYDKNMFIDDKVLQGQVVFVEGFGKVLCDVLNFLGLMFGNEMNQFFVYIYFLFWLVMQDEVGVWILMLFLVVEFLVLGLFYVYSEYDVVWYMDGYGFMLVYVLWFGVMIMIYFWIFNGMVQCYGGCFVVFDWYVEYLIELFCVFVIDLVCVVWLQEVGVLLNCFDEDEMFGFLEVMVCLVVCIENLWGIIWWCLYDVSCDFGDFFELEYFFGLIGQDGVVKFIGCCFVELIFELCYCVVLFVCDMVIVVDVDECEVLLSCVVLSFGGVVFQVWVDVCVVGDDFVLVIFCDVGDFVVFEVCGICCFICFDLLMSMVDLYGFVNMVVIF